MSNYGQKLAYFQIAAAQKIVFFLGLERERKSEPVPGKADKFERRESEIKGEQNQSLICLKDVMREISLSIKREPLKLLRV